MILLAETWSQWTKTDISITLGDFQMLKDGKSTLELSTQLVWNPF